VRLFVAVTIPQGISDRLSALVGDLSGLGADVKWVSPENFHFTVKFLGEVPEGRLAQVKAALQDAAVQRAPFALEVRGSGTFPAGRRPRVIWVGARGGGDALGELARDVDTRLAEAGFPRERKSFTSHLTVGRPRSAAGIEPVLAVLARRADRKWGEFDVRELTLMESRLSRQGAVYTPLATFPLTGS